ncbi:MAG: hypothetical protein JKY99_03835, partial [Rhizobiales bacterium]|nr:hypothetical protein [Hyphomicrobiales bacterium]
MQIIKKILVQSFIFVPLILSALAGFADALPASITSAQEDGYGRMVITFKGENLIPPYTS